MSSLSNGSGYNSMMVTDDDNDEPSASNKRLVRGDMAPKRISHLQFGILSPQEMQNLAEFQVCSRELFSMPSRTPAPAGCLDPRLGVSDKVSVCATCQRKLQECAGHFGYIKLALPVFHIGFFKHTVNFLQCICKTCSRVLIDEPERTKMLRQMRNPNTDALTKQALFKKVVEKCKKAKDCPYCGATNGTVKKITGAPTLKIVHERYKSKTARTANDDEIDELMGTLQTAIEYNKEIESIVNNDSNPPAEDCMFRLCIMQTKTSIITFLTFLLPFNSFFSKLQCYRRECSSCSRT